MPRPLQNRHSRTAPDESAPLSATHAVLSKCVRCRSCAGHCSFLAGHGSPGQMAAAYQTNPHALESQAFHCSLCGFCTTVCPQNLDLPAMFLEWRRTSVLSGRADLAPYHGILSYEKKGTSGRFSLYHLPEHCRTVFFPGCTLAGTRPANTRKAFDFLSQVMPGTGMVLDCCSKPSHDLGCQDRFQETFLPMATFLKDQGINTIITACPSCHHIFTACGGSIRALTLYQVMADHSKDLTRFLSESKDDKIAPLPGASQERAGLTAVFQDPCQARHDTETQTAVRDLARLCGIGITDLPSSGEKGYCCGEGGSVNCISPGLASSWAKKRQDAAGRLTALTYCAGCVNFLSRQMNSLHLLDLVFSRESALAGRAAVDRAPVTYLNRLKLKKMFRGMPAALSGSRQDLFDTRSGSDEQKKTRRKRRIAAVLAILVLAAGAARYL